MKQELILTRPDLLVRRAILEPGEVMPWHVDRCHRVSVVVRGDEITIEFRDTGERVAVAVHPGMAGMDEPDTRSHRAVNTGSSTFEEVVTFFLEPPGIDPQPLAP